MKGLPCRIDGINYESGMAAASALGILAGTLRWRLLSPSFPNYTSRYHPKKTDKKTLFACSIAGIEYISMSAAAKKLKLSCNTIKRRLASLDCPDYICAYIPKKLSKKKRKKNQKPCTIDGTDYESEYAAAKALGITIVGLQTRLYSSNFPGCISKYRPKIQRRKTRVRCRIKGVEYASIADVAKKFKILPTTISKRLKSCNYPDYVSADIPKKTPKTPKYSYRVNGKKYRTLQEIADEEGVTKERIRQKMNDQSYRKYKRFERAQSRKR